MLKIIRTLKELDFSQWMDVYEHSNRQWAKELYAHLCEPEQQLRTGQDMYGNLQCFLRDPDSFAAVWIVDGKYVSAVRFEPYEDGLLLEALETIPSQRRKGYAKQLVKALLTYLTGQGSGTVYSHIENNNMASLSVHKACGFQKILDHAVFADGSVSFRSCTYQKQLTMMDHI